MDPSLILGGLSGLAGLFGSNGGYQVPPGYGFANRMLKRVSRRLYQYATGVPGSGARFGAESSALNAGLGDLAASGREQLLASLGPNAEMNTTAGDALQRYASGTQSTAAMAQSALLNQDVLNRQNALTQAAGVAQPLLGGGPQYMQNPNGDLSSVFGALAQAATTNRLLRGSRPIYGIQQGGVGQGTPGGNDLPRVY